ncbi:MAG: nuclear transport factor 2 family protein [Myxococcota bacterium]
MNASELLDAHLERITVDLEQWLALFADDAVIEFPYAASLGTAARLDGKDAIRAYFGGSVPTMEDLAFSNVRRYPAGDPDVAWLEVHGAARIPSTGRRYEQDYVMFGRAREGQLVLYREYWDPWVAARAFGLELGTEGER